MTFDPPARNASFTDFKLHPSLLAGIKDFGFVRPTPIQAETIPSGFAGKDVLVRAMTGSGKTRPFCCRFSTS